MCRMILALGKIDVSRIIDAAKKMALDLTTSHELNQKNGRGTWQHGDGWGLAYLDEHNRWIVKKSTTAIFKDKKIDQLRTLKTKVLLLHIRKKAGSGKSIHNTHPFVAENPTAKNNVFETYLFCHNGHIEEEIHYDQSKYHPSGQTDSERLFYSILTDFEKNKNLLQAIRANFNRYQKAQGTNLMLAQKKRSTVAIRKNQYPIYYQMYLGKKKGGFIISSEKLPLAEFTWQPLEQGDIVTINHKTLTYSVDKDFSIDKKKL